VQVLQEAVQGMLEAKKLSQKINYSALEDLFKDETVSQGKRSQTRKEAGGGREGGDGKGGRGGERDRLDGE
jgi:hypothetical protein